MIVVPPRTFRTYQILPHTNSYFHRLHSSLDLSRRLTEAHGGSRRLTEAHGGSRRLTE